MRHKNPFWLFDPLYTLGRCTPSLTSGKTPMDNKLGIHVVAVAKQLYITVWSLPFSISTAILYQNGFIKEIQNEVFFI